MLLERLKVRSSSILEPFVGAGGLFRAQTLIGAVGSGIEPQVRARQRFTSLCVMRSLCAFLQ